MNNTQLSVYIGTAPAQTRKLFDPAREAFEDANLGEIGRDIADLYLNGQSPANYQYYLKKLDAVKLLSEQGGFKPMIAETIIKHGLYDPWVMLLASAQYFIGQVVTPEFETLIVQPSDDYLKLGDAKEDEKKEALDKARKTIAAISDPLRKASKELEKIDPWKMAGTGEESIRIEIQNMLEKLERIG